MREFDKVVLFLGFIVVLSAILNHPTAVSSIITAVGDASSGLIDAAGGIGATGSQVKPPSKK